jgi:hypothetical protein
MKFGSTDETPQQRKHRLLVTVGVTLLALVTSAVVVWAVGRDAGRPTVLIPPSAGVVAVRGEESWRWAADRLCERNSGASTTIVERRVGDEWRETTVPLTLLHDLSLGGGAGLALGRTPDCQPAYAYTTDSGAMWTLAPNIPIVLHAALAGDGARWQIHIGSSGAPEVARTAAPGSMAEVVSQPCGAEDGAPSLVVPVSAQQSWLLCQGPSLAKRLLLRTRDGGRTWERRIDNRADTGLGGDFTIRALALGSTDRGLMLTTSPRCPEGDLRGTVDAGLTWSELPCPALSLPMRVVLDVDLDPTTGRGLLLAIAKGQVRSLETRDGGSSWHEMSEAKPTSAGSRRTRTSGGDRPESVRCMRRRCARRR